MVITVRSLAISRSKENRLFVDDISHRNLNNDRRFWRLFSNILFKYSQSL